MRDPPVFGMGLGMAPTSGPGVSASQGGRVEAAHVCVAWGTVGPAQEGKGVWPAGEEREAGLLVGPQAEMKKGGRDEFLCLFIFQNDFPNPFSKEFEYHFQI